MRVSAVETFLVPPRWLFLKVSTDEGVTGWGEATLEGRSHTAQRAVHEFEDYLVGSNPLRIEDHWQVMTKSTFYRGGPVFATAVAGIDQALWDILGKTLNAPVHQLLGGPVRERIRVYSWIGGDDPTDVAEQAIARKEAGLTAVKLNATGATEPLGHHSTVSSVLRLAETVREAIGDDMDFAIDFHGRVPSALSRRALAAIGHTMPMFAEEPVLPEHAALRLGDITQTTTIPIALGERLYSRHDFLPLLEAGIAVAQPDLSHAGGISEVRRIAALAEIYDVMIAPHCPLGPIALAACLQVDFATPNFLIQEQSGGIHYNNEADLLDYLIDPTVYSFSDGYCRRPTGSGLGIEVDEPAVRRAAELGHRWRGPTWRRADGSFAEW